MSSRVFTYSSQSPNIQIHGFITAESQKKPWRLISTSTQSSSMFNDVFLSFRFESTLRLFPVGTDLKKLKHKRIYHPDYNTLLAGGQRSYEYAARIGEEIGGLSKFWATSPHPKGFIPGAEHWERIIKQGNGRCFYDVKPRNISENENLKGLQFQRVVFFMPKEPKVDEVENLLDHGKHLLDAKENAQLHFFANAKAKYHAWDLEKTARKYGLFCNKQIRIPWGGLKRIDLYNIVSFSFEEEEEEEEEEESDFVFGNCLL
ncbi:hypothetical protein HanIR_Chr12g0573021 [Helianthus annuus]|uniref:Uncharacterized protein n=1 Tax=Helianthus annuus TaxID=4232 RepID=A0A251T0Q4_HELAN|nr:hypothetical protein HanIR_Chr12g0573021 [Helianthus annuus]